MLRLTYLGLMIGLVLAQSCSNDDDDPEPGTPLLLGTWQPLFAIDYSCVYETTMKIEFADPCALEDELSFGENTFSEVFYLSENNSCLFDRTVNGNWHIQKEGLMLNNELYDYFTVSSDTLKLGHVFSRPADGSCNTQKPASAYYTVYIRQ